MTINGAIMELVMLCEHPMMPNFFKPSIQKVIETISEAELVEPTDTADTPQTDSEITRNSLRSDCTGCRFIGWYDTEFPCVNCIRKNKDYYDLE